MRRKPSQIKVKEPIDFEELPAIFSQCDSQGNSSNSRLEGAILRDKAFTKPVREPQRIPAEIEALLAISGLLPEADHGL